MNEGDEIVTSLRGLVQLFSQHCSEQSTLTELQRLIENPDRWIEAHDLFSRIRDKTLKAGERKDHLLITQYCFEEICAKALFNFTDTDAPFDADSPYFVIPLALRLARALHVSDEEVIQIVAPW